MLNRRQLLQTTIAGGLLGPKLVYAKRPMGGVMLEQKDFRFHNATVLDAKGIVHTNWGGEVKEGILSLSKDITDGSDLGGKWIVPNFIKTLARARVECKLTGHRLNIWLATSGNQSNPVAH